MKKIISITLIFFFVVLACFSITLPNGQNVAISKYEEKDGRIVAVIISANTNFTVGNLTIPAATGSRVRFYDSGAIEWISCTNMVNIETKVGQFRTARNKTLHFYESGALKRLVAYGSTSGIKLTTPFGEMLARSEMPINFYEDGSLDSFYPRYGQKISFLSSGEYYDDAILSFYPSGEIKEFTPNPRTMPPEMKEIYKPRTSMSFYPSGNVKAFTPLDGYGITFNEMFFLHISGTPLVKFDGDDVSKLKSFTADLTLENLSIGSVTISPEIAKNDEMNTTEGSMRLLNAKRRAPATFSLKRRINNGSQPVAVTFEINKMNSVKKLLIHPFTFESEHQQQMNPYSPHFSIEIEGRIRGVKAVSLYNSGKLESVQYHPPLLIDDEKDENGYYEVLKSFYSEEGKEVARAAIHYYVHPETEAKDKTTPAIFIYDESDVQIISCSLSDLNNIDTITFNDEGKVNEILIQNEDGKGKQLSFD